MKKLLSILVFIFLLSGTSYSQPTTEYLGNNEWIIKRSNTCFYKGEIKSIGKKKGLFKTKQKGTPHGYGVFDCDGNIADGIFRDGKFVNGTMTTSNRDLYEGNFNANGKLIGQGKYTKVDGSFWEGTFENGLIRGKGIYYDAKEKKTWKGNITKDGFSGATKVYHDNGVIESGTCQNGSCNFNTIKSLEDIKKTKEEKKNKDNLYKKIYNKCILNNLKGQSDSEAIKIIKNACKEKAENPSMLDKLLN